MVKKLAIDWDDNELRLVAAQCSGRSVKVTDAAVIPVQDAGIVETLRSVIQQRGLQETETLVAIGRGKAELRELQLPPVPDEELPDMVRFQAIRSFATAGDSATVDFLVTNRGESGIEMIAAAVGPASLTQIRETCEAAELLTKRIALRPLAAASLYLLNHPSSSGKDTVLIDLLADDAEIVVAREGHVIFVRTVRMPTGDATRGRALAGELNRSLLACGSSGPLDRIVLWGRKSVHADDVKMLAEAAGAEVDVLDPFALVDVDRKVKSDLPEHVGRLAPLVGLLASDENDADRLIDFLNPRQRVEEAPSPYRTALMFGVPVAAALLLALAVYSQFSGLDRQIAELKSQNAAMKPDVDRALASINRTEKLDEYLDGDVNWLREIRRLATSMPPSDKLIVRSLSGTVDRRSGGGTLNVEGGATNHDVIFGFEEALSDPTHVVTGTGVSEQKTEDVYRLGFSESVTVTPESIRNDRYAAMNTPASQTPPPHKPPSDDPPPDQPPLDDPPAGESAPMDESRPAISPPDQPAPDTAPSQNSDATDGDGDGEGPVDNDQPKEAEQPDEAELAAETQGEVQS